ncbi:hypothetical protein KIPB_014114, partial [Kipferlia bialata]
ALVSDDVSKVLQRVEDRITYRATYYNRGIFKSPWSGWEIEQAVSGKDGVAFLRYLCTEFEDSSYGGFPSMLLCLGDTDNLRVLIHRKELSKRYDSFVGDVYRRQDTPQWLLDAYRDIRVDMERQQHDDTDNVIFGSEAPLLCFFMSLLTPSTEPELRLAVYDYLTSVMPHVLCLSMRQKIGENGYDETMSNSTLDQFLRKGYHDVVLPMAGEMLPEADMTDEDLLAQASNWARGISYVHNIFSWPA